MLTNVEEKFHDYLNAIILLPTFYMGQMRFVEMGDVTIGEFDTHYGTCYNISWKDGHAKVEFHVNDDGRFSTIRFKCDSLSKDEVYSKIKSTFSDKLWCIKLGSRTGNVKMCVVWRMFLGDAPNDLTTVGR